MPEGVVSGASSNLNFDHHQSFLQPDFSLPLGTKLLHTVFCLGELFSAIRTGNFTAYNVWGNSLMQCKGWFGNFLGNHVYFGYSYSYSFSLGAAWELL